MEFFHSYFTMQPLELDWMKVSPAAEGGGIEYHLTPDLFLRIEDIVSGNNNFIISEFIMDLEAGKGKEGEVANRMADEATFAREYLANKSQARVTRSFEDPDISAFFRRDHIDILEVQFQNNQYFAGSITVFYRNQKVDDVLELGKDDFRIVTRLFDDLGVQGSVDFRKNKEEFEQKYDEALKEKVASRESEVKKSVWNRLTKKESRKQTITALATTAIGVAGWVAKRALMSMFGIWGKLAAVVVGTVGICLEAYGRNELGEIVRGLKVKAEGVF